MKRRLVLDLGRCLRRRVKWSSCTRCIEACPEEAIEATPRGISINEYLCTFCLNCVGVCPTSAISCEPCTLLPRGEKREQLVIGCLGDADVRVCINALRLEHYIVAAAHSSRLCVRIACSSCGLRGRGLEVLERARSLLGDRIVVEEAGLQQSRRGLLKDIVRTVTGTGALAVEVSIIDSPPRRASSSLYREAWRVSREQGIDYKRVAPIVDTGRCDLCGFCAAVCPTGAILVLDDGVVVVDHAGCVSCGECVEQCPRGALSLHETSEQSRVYHVDVAVCPVCGYSYPRGAGECPKCSQLRREIIEFYSQVAQRGG